MNKDKLTIKNSQIGVIGNHAHVEGGIHFHGLFDRLDAWRKAHPWRFAFALVGVVLLVTLAGTALVGTLSPDIRQTLFLRGLWPRAFPKEREGEVLIVIATFHHSEGVTDTEAHNEIKRAIEEAAADLDFATLRVAVDPNARLAAIDRAGAQALGDRYDASLIIWGADTGVRISVNFYNRKQPEFEAADVRLEETVRTQLAAPSRYTEFITQDLPNQITFLSLFAVGQSYFATGEYTASVQVLEAAVGRLGDSPTIASAAEAYFGLGWLYDVFLHNTTKALVNYTRAIELAPEDGMMYLNRGLTHYAMANYPKALADYTHAIELDPENAAALINRGVVYGIMGYYSQALADLIRVIELNPENARAYTDRGLVYSGMGNYDKALADYAYAIELAPENALTYINRGALYNRLADYPNALADYTRAIELAPTYATVHYNRGNTYAKMTNYPEALTDFTRAIELDPAYAAAFKSRGDTYQIMADYDRALADFTRAIEINPEYAEAYRSRGPIYYKIGDYTKALSDCTRAIEIDPTDTETYRNRGGIYWVMGEYEKALIDYNRVLELDPEDTIAYLGRGVTYYDMGDYKRSMTDYTRAAELMPDPLIYYSLAGVYALLDSPIEACAWLEKAITLNTKWRNDARTAPDFDPIRDEPCFQALMNDD